MPDSLKAYNKNLLLLRIGVNSVVPGYLALFVLVDSGDIFLSPAWGVRGFARILARGGPGGSSSRPGETQMARAAALVAAASAGHARMEVFGAAAICNLEGRASPTVKAGLLRLPGGCRSLRERAGLILRTRRMPRDMKGYQVGTARRSAPTIMAMAGSRTSRYGARLDRL